MSTIQNFGTPNGGGSGRGAILQPKVKWKYRVRFFGFGPIAGGLELTQSVIAVNRPEITQEKQSVHSYNSYMNYLGKHSFNDINLRVRDDVTNSVAKLVGHQMQKQMNHLEQTSPLAAANYKFEMVIETMDGGDGVLETWELEGCACSVASYGEFEYSASDPMEVALTIIFDNATQTGGLMPANPQLRGGFTL